MNPTEAKPAPIRNPIIIRINDPEAQEFDGAYVADYSPQGETVMPFGSVLDCDLTITWARKEAKRFRSFADALECYRSSHGYRADGEPHRPLTAWSVDVEPL